MNIYHNRGPETVYILRRRNNILSPTGIYRCDIPTNAVNDRIGYNSVRDTVYVGLYTASGGMFYNNTATQKCIGGLFTWIYY